MAPPPASGGASGGLGRERRAKGGAAAASRDAAAPEPTTAEGADPKRLTLTLSPSLTLSRCALALGALDAHHSRAIRRRRTLTPTLTLTPTPTLSLSLTLTDSRAMPAQVHCGGGEHERGRRSRVRTWRAWARPFWLLAGCCVVVDGCVLALQRRRGCTAAGSAPSATAYPCPGPGPGSVPVPVPRARAGAPCPAGYALRLGLGLTPALSGHEDRDGFPATATAWVRRRQPLMGRGAGHEAPSSRQARTSSH